MKENSGFELLGMWLVIIGGFIGGTLYEGWVLVKLWQWFVVDFFNVETLPIKVAIGLSFMVTYLTFRADLATKDTSDQSPTERIWTYLGYVILKPTVFLLSGYVVNLL